MIQRGLRRLRQSFSSLYNSSYATSTESQIAKFASFSRFKALGALWQLVCNNNSTSGSKFSTNFCSCVTYSGRFNKACLIVIWLAPSDCINVDIRGVGYLPNNSVIGAIILPWGKGDAFRIDWNIGSSSVHWPCRNLRSENSAREIQRTSLSSLSTARLLNFQFGRRKWWWVRSAFVTNRKVSL